jgi:hypothetical protein
MINKLKMTAREIKTSAMSAILSIGCRVTGVTKDDDILSLMRTLSPRDCGVNLIRVGGSRDGGYLIPDDLDGVEYCFSPGVSTVSDFEDQLATLHIRSFMADYSIDEPPISRQEFTFDRKFLASSDRNEFFTLASWKDKYLKNYKADLLLQMDIEGSEYEVILSTPDSLLDQFRIIVIEFHDLDRIFDPSAFSLILSCFEKLLRSFHVVHIHPNNYCEVVRKGRIEIPRVMEFTFYNKKRVNSSSPQIMFPHELDSDNAPRKHVPLPKCWYSSK